MQNPISWVPIYIINYNVVTTEPIFKIRNFTESYYLPESENNWYGHRHTSPYLLCAPAIKLSQQKDMYISQNSSNLRQQ